MQYFPDNDYVVLSIAKAMYSVNPKCCTWIGISHSLIKKAFPHELGSIKELIYVRMCI